MSTVFQQGAIKHFTKEVPPPNPPAPLPEKYLVLVNGRMAVGN